MREVLSIHVGQCGVQLGGELWQLYCLEHGINPNGDMTEGNGDFEFVVVSEKDEMFKSFFSDNDCKYRPRAIFADLENDTCDELRYSSYRNMYSFDDQIVSSGLGGGMNFARGHLTAGKDILEETMNKIRKLTDQCDNFQGFMLHHATGGGTGSGLTSLLLERLTGLYDKKERVSVTVHPSPTLTSGIVEPYNHVLAMQNLIDYVDASICFDNQGAYRICKKYLDIERPSYKQINRLMAHNISDLTISLRSDSALNGELLEFRQNLVPYPRAHFLLPSYSPFTSREQGAPNPDIPAMTAECFSRDNSLANCDVKQGKLLAASLMFRGRVVPRDVSIAIGATKINREIQFVDWCPTGFKCGINYPQPIFLCDDDLRRVNQSVCLLANSTAYTSSMMSPISQRFDLMYSKRAYVHWFVREGLEEGELYSARESVAELEKDFEEIDAEVECDDDGDCDEY